MGVFLVLLMACRQDEAPSAIRLTSPLELEPAPQVAPLTPSLRVQTALPTRLTLRVEGEGTLRELAFPDETKSHRAMLLGFRTGQYTVTASLSAGDSALELEPIEVVIGPPPVTFPQPVLHVAHTEEMEPGYTWMVVSDTERGVGFLVALDGAGEPTYLLEVPSDMLSATLTPAGELAAVAGFGLTFLSLQGEMLRRYTGTPTEPHDIGVAYTDFHHALVVQPGGDMFTLSYRHTEVPEYPVSYDALDTYGPATIREDLLVHLAPDGATLEELSTLELLDARRVGFDSLEPGRTGALDWVHVNDLQYDADTDELTFSSRHQDAVIQVSRTGQLQWILGHPEGWPPQLAPFVLSPTAPLVWFSHQHGIELDPDGRLRMFDNGNHERNSPYHDSGESGDYSRLFEVVIDEEAMTVAPALDLRYAPEGELLYVGSLGSAQRMAVTDNRLGTWGPFARIVEFNPSGEVVWDLQFSEEWRVDRAARLPTLYPPGIEDGEQR